MYFRNIPKVFTSHLPLKKKIYMLWFKFVLGLMFFELVSVLFAIVPHYGNEYTTKENKNETSLKNFAPKLNLNHNIYIYLTVTPELSTVFHKNL